ncbi:MAG TPA: efflux RND transporter periplasmic adaptor subunit [Chitinophagaceae bacterium]|nr:efflux RND transporter periplasmic adaptor subunit [Chitinophagaceae bacterium]
MNMIHKIKWLAFITITVLFIACNNGNKKAAVMYTCPMPQDSVFSDKPGKCPKCGMDLVLMENHTMHTGHDMADSNMTASSGYTCPMHPNVHSDTAGTCPVCGMKLEKVKSALEPKAVSLNTLLKPSNRQVIANVPMIHMMAREEDIEMESYGFITYDTRQTGVISSNFAGRIEKLYVKYRYQKIAKGQRIMDIYSPELLTAQENLLFLLKNDLENTMLINAAKQKLYLLGMSNQQLNDVIKTGKPSYKVSVFSNYSGHIHESNSAGMNNNQAEAMRPLAVTTEELSVKEGMYVKKGQNIFSVYNPNRAWALLNIFTGQAALVKTGNKVRITPETDPASDFRAAIDYIEPVYRDGSKTVTARVYFDNSAYKIPIGSQVKATIFAGDRSANWLPEEAVLSLGLDKIVFVRTGEAFMARKIETGITNKHLVQVLSGLGKTEAVAANAQYLVDSESFIKTN